MNLQKLVDKKLIFPPNWLPSNVHYLAITGSKAYGCHQNNKSDDDIVGWCFPRKETVFPHLNGYIHGFGNPPESFEVWQQHHVKDDQKQYDFTIYSIIKFVQLCMKNNANILDVLFVPQQCVIHCTQTAQILRDRRKEFLHKGAYSSFRGYSFSQMNKMATKNPKEGSNRYEDIKINKWDRKYGYHLVRLLLECEQILATGDLDLQRDSETYKAIRRGDWTEQQVRDFFAQKEKYLEELYQKSTLPHRPNEDKIKEILLQVLEQHYGSLEKAITLPEKESIYLKQIGDAIRKLGY
jgi:predicted nucleotidyltransferase